MKRLIVYAAAAMFATGASYALQNTFNAQQMSLNQLPAPAQKAITQHSGGAQPSSITAETFDGWTTYKVTFGNQSKPMRVDAEGRLLGEYWRTIPPAVEQSADARIGQNAIQGYSKTEMNGQPVYHFRYNNQNGQPGEIWIGQNGNIVKSTGATAVVENAGAINSTQPNVTTTGGNGTWVQFKDLPWPVQQTMMAQANGANINRVYQTMNNGQTVYNARINQNGTIKRVSVGQDGSLLNTSAGGGFSGGANAGANDTTPLSAASKVSFNQLPQAVQSSINSQANGAPVEDIDKGTLNGQTVYEAAFKRNGQTYEVRVREDGTVLGGHFD